MVLTYSAANAVIVKNLDHAHRDGADLLKQPMHLLSRI